MSLKCTTKYFLLFTSFEHDSAAFKLHQNPDFGLHKRRDEGACAKQQGALLWRTDSKASLREQ